VKGTCSTIIRHESLICYIIRFTGPIETFKVIRIELVRPRIIPDDLCLDYSTRCDIKSSIRFPESNLEFLREILREEFLPHPVCVYFVSLKK